MPAFMLPMVKFYDAIGKWLHLKTFRSKFVSKYFSHQDLLELVKSSFREVCNLTDLTAKPLPLSLLVNRLRKLRNIKQQLYSSVHPFCLAQWSFSQNIFSDSFEIYFTTRTCWLSFCHFSIWVDLMDKHLTWQNLLIACTKKVHWAFKCPIRISEPFAHARKPRWLKFRIK